MNNDCFVVGGAGDQAAAAIGNGIVKIGDVSIVLGSSGVVFTPIDKEGFDLGPSNVQVYLNLERNSEIKLEKKYLTPFLKNYPAAYCVDLQNILSVVY